MKFPNAEIARMLGISRSLLYNKIKEIPSDDLPPRYSEIDDEELDILVHDIKQSHPGKDVCQVAEDGSLSVVALQPAYNIPYASSFIKCNVTYKFKSISCRCW